MQDFASVVERSITRDCKSRALRLRRFESCPAHHRRDGVASSWRVQKRVGVYYGHGVRGRADTKV